MDRSTDVRSFLPGLYPVSALLVLVPLVDLLSIGWPLRPAEAAWRFGSIGLGFGAMTVQVLGIALAMATAAALAHHRVLRLLALVTLGVATVIVAGMARFLLDYGQLRVAIPSAERAGFDGSTLRALISATLCVPVLFALGARALAHTRSESAELDEQDLGNDPFADVIPFRYRRPN